MIPHPLCFWRTVWRSLRIGARVSGHDFKEDDEPMPPNVSVLKCMTCGHIDVTWWDGPVRVFAENGRLQRADWQPISTAPLDYTLVLCCYWNGDVERPAWSYEIRQFSPEDAPDDEGEFWMLLPPGPLSPTGAAVCETDPNRAADRSAPASRDASVNRLTPRVVVPQDHGGTAVPSSSDLAPIDPPPPEGPESG